MKRLCLSLLFLCSTIAHAQFLQYYSYISIDAVTGEIFGQGYTAVDVAYYDPYAGDRVTAGVVTQVQNYVDGQNDNCGAGCAVAQAYGQVLTLGETYTDSSAHSGEVFYADGGNFFEYDVSSMSQSVPSAPYIELQLVDASQPHSVTWNYYVSGTQPYDMLFQLGDLYNINTAYPTGTFYTDQMSYPSGYNIALISAHLYGIQVNGPYCPIIRTDSYNAPNSTVLSRGDGNVGGYISVTHSVDEIVTHFQYNCAYAPYPGTADVTTLIAATGSIDTSNNPAHTNNTIYTITETNNHGFVDTLGPNSPMSATFQSRIVTYPIGTWWLTIYDPVSICNTALILLDTTSGTDAVIPTNSMGCLDIPLPNP